MQARAAQIPKLTVHFSARTMAVSTCREGVRVANLETERLAIEYVRALECRAGRQPEDVHLRGFPYDVSSPPRK